MSILEKVLENLENRSPDQVRKIFMEALKLHLDSASGDPIPSYLSEEEEAMLRSVGLRRAIRRKQPSAGFRQRGESVPFNVKVEPGTSETILMTGAESASSGWDLGYRSRVRSSCRESADGCPNSRITMPSVEQPALSDDELIYMEAA